MPERALYKRVDLEAQVGLSPRTVENYHEWGVIVPVQQGAGRRPTLYDDYGVAAATIGHWMMAHDFNRVDAAMMGKAVAAGVDFCRHFDFCRYRPDLSTYRGKPDPEADYVLDLQHQNSCKVLERENPERGFRRLLNLGEWVTRLVLELAKFGEVRSVEPAELEFWDEEDD